MWVAFGLALSISHFPMAKGSRLIFTSSFARVERKSKAALVRVNGNKPASGIRKSAAIGSPSVIKMPFGKRVKRLRTESVGLESTKIGLMVTLTCAVIAYVRALLVPRHKLALEAAALRQQLAVWKRKQPRPKLHRLDRLFWIALRQLWSGWAEALIIVKPETVVSWHRAGFRLFWRPSAPGTAIRNSTAFCWCFNGAITQAPSEQT